MLQVSNGSRVSDNRTPTPAPTCSMLHLTLAYKFTPLPFPSIVCMCLFRCYWIIKRNGIRCRLGKLGEWRWAVKKQPYVIFDVNVDVLFCISWDFFTMWHSTDVFLCIFRRWIWIQGSKISSAPKIFPQSQKHPTSRSEKLNFWKFML